MDRSKYPKDWTSISKRIRDRGANRCETCKVPNGAFVARCGGKYMLETGETYDEETGDYLGMTRGSEMGEALGEHRFVKIVLTTAHLNHDTSDNRDENLKSLCQLHHLRLDADHHAVNARATRRGRKAVGNLPGVE